MRLDFVIIMKKHFIIALLAIVLLPNFADAQRWKRYRRQVIGGVGVTNFLGDLGGANQIGRDFVYDLDFQSTRPSLLIGYRYQLNNYFFLRSNLQWGILRSDDDLTEEKFRNERQLTFRSGFLELNVMGEFYFIQNARGNLYKLKGVRGRRGLKMDIYAFGGIGLMYFNPKAEYQGQWVALQPIGTEGQGLPGQPDKYRRTTFTIPYGIGIGKSLDRYWSINVELTLRKTFTDYIDDVSGDYYGRVNIFNAKIAAGESEENAKRAAILSDPNINTINTIEGLSVADLGGDNARNQSEGRPNQVNNRGDSSDKDSFMTGMITISKKITKRRRSRPKF